MAIFLTFSNFQCACAAGKFYRTGLRFCMCYFDMHSQLFCTTHNRKLKIVKKRSTLIYIYTNNYIYIYKRIELPQFLCQKENNKSFGILERFPTKYTKYFFPFSFSFSIEKKRTFLLPLAP